MKKIVDFDDNEETIPTHLYPAQQSQQIASPLIPMLQLCFVIDGTGSMDHYVKLLRDSLLKMFRLFNEYKLSNKTQIGFVVYRDFSEDDQAFTTEVKQYKKAGWAPQKKIEYRDFENFTLEEAKQGGKIYNYLDDLVDRCDGGDDYAEDIAGGFAKMLELSWLPDAKTTKIAVLITDAPCHGKEFHDGVIDNFQDLSLKREADIRPQLEKMIAKRINLSIIEINKKTHKMVKVINNFYDSKERYDMFQSTKLIENLDKLQNIGQLDFEQLSLLTITLLEKLEMTMKVVKSI